MIKSMTGFGRANTTNNKHYSFSIEIKSVNHRYLDLNIRMPKSLISLEEKMRAMVGKNISRGKVDIFITYKNYEDTHNEAVLNVALADSYVKCLQEISQRYDMKNDISLSLISRFPEVIKVEEREENLELIWEELCPTLKEALDLLVSMRLREGEKLKEDIIVKTNCIRTMVDEIALLAPNVIKQYRTKLSERLKELDDNLPIDENRLAMEFAIFADKASIDEEITRLYSHLNQLIETLALDDAIGRKLDFIVQEMNREANTIASKSQSIEITKIILNVKNEIEKIREQVQNIE